MNREEFIYELEKLGITLTPAQELKLEKFYNLLIEWNQKINLTLSRVLMCLCFLEGYVCR